MNKIKAIIVDDEFSARNVLKNLLIRNCPNIDIVATCDDVPSAAKMIKKLQPNLVFLDIQMPTYNGYELINFVDKVNFEIIFVTAYNQYAIKAFELNATDYLLKPVGRDRLRTAVKKAIDKIKDQKNYEHYLELIENLNDTKHTQFVVSNSEGKHIVKFKNLVSIKGDGSYCTLYLLDGSKLLISKNLKHYQEVLEVDSRFYRCHKSWLINLDLVKKLNTTKLNINLENNQTIKLSKSKKIEIQDLLVNH